MSDLWTWPQFIESFQSSGVVKLLGLGALMFIVIGGLVFLSHNYTLRNIKAKTVGDGQHGTARWATKKEIQRPIRISHSKLRHGAKVINYRRSKGSYWDVPKRKVFSKQS